MATGDFSRTLPGGFSVHIQAKEISCVKPHRRKEVSYGKLLAIAPYGKFRV